MPSVRDAFAFAAASLLAFCTSCANGQSAVQGPLQIHCALDIHVSASPGEVVEIGYLSTVVATSSGGVGPVVIYPDPANPITLSAQPVSQHTFRYTARDATGVTASCTVVLEIDLAPCPTGAILCDDPHMVGLRGQKINWSGVDGGWYCLVKDDEVDLHMNVRVTAPLPDEFPDRQLITGLSILSESHSYVIEVKDPYSVITHGCPQGVAPCLSNGGLRFTIDGIETDTFLGPVMNEYMGEGVLVSSSNLPAECRQFGAEKVWARLYAEMLAGERQLTPLSFSNWVLSYENMAAPDWCRRYISLYNLADVQSAYSVLRITTPSVGVSLHTGIAHQGDGELDWDGRLLPNLEFWQMNVGLEALSIDSDSLSGILGETARPVVDSNGHEVMEGQRSFRGDVEDYRVIDALGTDFAFNRRKVT